MKSSGGYGWYRNVRSSSTMTAKSYLEGVNHYEYDIYKNSKGNPKITFLTGAKLKVKSTCKKAHKNTYLQRTTSTGSYEGDWTSPSTSYFGSSCTTSTGGITKPPLTQDDECHEMCANQHGTGTEGYYCCIGEGIPTRYDCVDDRGYHYLTCARR